MSAANTNIELAAGESVTLQYVGDATDVKWSSLSPFGYVSNTDGVLTLIAYSSPTNPNYSYPYTTTLTIFANGEETVYSVTIYTEVSGILERDDDWGEVYIGYTEAMPCTPYPSGASVESMVWTSSDTSVATVDQTGLVTFVGAGSVTIKVTVNGEFSASSYFTVVADEIDLKDVTLDEEDIALTVGETAYADYTLTPTNANHNGYGYIAGVEWGVKNKAVATIDANGKITAVGAGTTSYWVSVVDEDGTSNDYDYGTITVTAIPVEEPEEEQMSAEDFLGVYVGEEYGYMTLVYGYSPSYLEYETTTIILTSFKFTEIYWTSDGQSVVLWYDYTAFCGVEDAYFELVFETGSLLYGRDYVVELSAESGNGILSVNWGYHAGEPMEGITFRSVTYW